MIKHSIDKHPPPKDHTNYRPQWPQFRSANTQILPAVPEPRPSRWIGLVETVDHGSTHNHGTVASPNGMSKLQYAQFLKNLPIKVGDLVTSVFSRKPYHAHGVYRVESIDEIHRFVEWGPTGVGPLCLNLRRCREGATPHKGGANNYQVVGGADIPGEWMEYIKKTGVHVNAND